MARPDWQGSVATPTPDPWGDASSGLGYRGELTVDGLVWLRHRAYDPTTRAFLSPDPLPPVPGTSNAANPYHYAGNDPINQLDPLGLRPMTDTDAQAQRESGGLFDRIGNRRPECRVDSMEGTAMTSLVRHFAESLDGWEAAALKGGATVNRQVWPTPDRPDFASADVDIPPRLMHISVRASGQVDMILIDTRSDYESTTYHEVASTTEVDTLLRRAITYVLNTESDAG